MWISAYAIERARRPVLVELAERNPAYPRQFIACLRNAQHDIERRLRIAAHHEGITPGDLVEFAMHRLAESVTNYALALLGAWHRGEELRAQAGQTGVATMSEWVRTHRERDETFSALALFEQWVIDGHPLHPAAKVRLGLSPAEAVGTCPEWGNIIELPVAVLAVSSLAEYGLAGSSGPQPGPLTRLLLREHPQLERELGPRRDGVDHFALLPLHPWQAAHVLQADYSAELSRGLIQLLRGRIPARPLISYRTVAPLPTSATGWPSHLKTALSVRLTNALRGVSPAAAQNGPAVSQLLEQILSRETDFGGRLGIVSETAAAHFRPSDPLASRPRVPGGDAELSADAALAALARSNPEADLGRDELLLPVAALWARSPLTGKPVLAELLRQVQRTVAAASDSGQSGALFARHYAEVCLPPLLTLLTRYGIALEAHGENTLLVLRDGLPVRCIVRDLGGIRIHFERLMRTGLTVALRPGSAIVTSDPDQLRNKLYYALFVNDLNQLVRCLAHCTGAPQATLWRHFGSVAYATFQALAADPVLATGPADDAVGLLGRPWPNKALLTMWLRGDVTDYTYLPTTNPLCTASGRHS